jgi:GT2 family glycosyltransferase
MDKLLAIVIPAWNNYHAYTKKTLQFLKKLPPNHKVFLIDNASTDDTKFLVSSKNIEIIHNKNNLFFAKACNQGFTLAKTQGFQHVMFLNNDIKIIGNYDSWTKPIILQAEKGKIVGPTVGCLDDNLNFICESNKFPVKGHWYISGWNITASVNTWNKLILPHHKGPINEIFGFYFEDTDLSLRAQKLNIVCEIIPVPVKHFGKATSKKLGLNELYLRAKNIFLNQWQGKL